MNIDKTFLPVAVELIQKVFPTSIVYQHTEGRSYSTLTGKVESVITEYEVPAGVLSRSRTEQGGVGETYTIDMWVDHSPQGLPFLPRTGDHVVYDNVRWKITTIAPTFSSKGLIASKIQCSAD